MNFYTDIDIGSMDKSSTFEELSRIAIEIIKRMPQPLGMVSGPISHGGAGSVELNLRIFKETIQPLLDNGIFIFDQVPFEKHMRRICQNPEYYKGDSQLLNAFYLPVFESGLIRTMYFIPGWESSSGAKWEREQVIRLGMNIKDL